jgi:hypothetical protein
MENPLTVSETISRAKILESRNMKPSTGDGAETRAHFTRLPGLADPVLQFDLAKEIEQLRTKESWGRENWTEFRHPGCQQEGC